MLDSMIALLAELVCRPSRGGEDPPEPVLQAISDWLDAHSISSQTLHDESGLCLGLYGEIQGKFPGPIYLLNATADTAPFGDMSAWRYPPNQPTIKNGWMYGRGTADSKAGISVFCHVLADLLSKTAQLSGTIGFLFDVEEHSGSFAGIRRYMTICQHQSLSGVMIGYPGNDRLVTGARGFLRARLSIHGIGAHSGSSTNRGVNAIERVRKLLGYLANESLPLPDETFPLPPQITATSIRGGGCFSLVPDVCELELDIRTTPAFDDLTARKHLETAVAWLDVDRVVPKTGLEWIPGWPAYRLDPENSMVKVLIDSACSAFGHTIPKAVVGPSSIANFLSTLSIPATAGLGVSYRNIHSPDESVLLKTLMPAFQSYRNALLNLLGSRDF